MQEIDLPKESVAPSSWFGVESPLFTQTKVRWMFRLVAVTLGTFQAWAARNVINPDGRSHLEVARAYLRTDWSMAVNAYWGPLYSWIMAAVLGATKPGLRAEFPVIHAMNFVLFVFLILAFELFWSELLLSSQAVRNHDSGDKAARPPTSVLWLMGYALFIWLTTSLLVPLINADLCVAIFVLLDLGLLLKINNRLIPGSPVFIFFGMALAAGYMAKAVMFPIGFVFLALSAVSCNYAGNRKRLVWSLLIFLFLSAPVILSFSHAKGHLTFSESGKLPFAWSNYNLPIRNWQGEPPSSGIPLHPTRKIYDHPAVFEFNGPIRASYPPWYDPSYWNAGMSPTFSTKVVLRHALQNLPEMAASLLLPRIWLCGLLVLFLFSQLRATAAGILRHWYLLTASAILFGLYLLSFWELRYLPAWIIVFWGVVIAGLRIRQGTQHHSLLLWIALLAALLPTLQIAHGIYGQMRNVRPDDATPDYVTAEGLKKIGVQPGEKVASIGFDNDAYFAYLGGLSVVAEINTQDTCEFWQASPAIQTGVMESFRRAGVQVVVANLGGSVRNTTFEIPADVAKCARPGPDWLQIEGSPNRALWLK